MRIAKEAWPFAAIAVAVTTGGAWLHPLAAVLPAAALLFVLWFFRDPDRRPAAGDDHLISPADGKVIRASADRISVFMNVFNVHVCRTPLDGNVESVDHRPGRFLAAFKDEAPEENERTTIAIRGPRAELRFTLVAGLVARRIVCKVRPGQTLLRGERVGLIRFGSRVDVQLPEGARPTVRVGDRVRAGETPIARL